MNRILNKSLFLGSLLMLASAVVAEPTASIFVKDPAEFKKIQSELESIKGGMGDENPQVMELLKEANDIARMNDRCSMISINEVLDEECGRFYAEDLPAFETKYMELTGEFRLGSLKMGTSLAERTEQIKVCAKALGGIIIPKMQLLKLNGNMFLEPLSFEGAFDATYDFNFYYDSERMGKQREMMERWTDKCAEIALRQGRDEFAPLFVQSVELINDSLEKSKSNVRIVLEPEYLDFYVDMNESVAGAYYLNGALLFSSQMTPAGRDFSHLIVDLANKQVKLPLGVDGEMQKFKGRVEFTAAYQEKDLVGRWVWGDREFANQAVAKGEISSTAIVGDSTKPKPIVKRLGGSVEDTLDNDLKEMKAKDAARDAGDGLEKMNIHWVPLSISAVVAIGGGVLAIISDNKAKTECDKGVSRGDTQTYESRHKKIDRAQKMRNIGVGVAAAGVVGVGLSIIF